MHNVPPKGISDRVPDSHPAVEVIGWGCAIRASDGIAELRRSLPDWAPTDTPSHFFKYADEQTLLAVYAIDDAIRSCGMDPTEHRDWGVIAAPQFLGRQVTAQAVDVYLRTGGQRVSPHIVPQNSLHSVSGALSILLATRGLNVGLGGGPDSLTDGLLGAMSLVEMSPSPGTWFVASGWDPEPLPDEKGESASPGVCYAFALAIRRSAGGGQGRLTRGHSLRVFSDELPRPVTVADVAAEMQASGNRPTGMSWSWRMSWGETLRLDVAPRRARQRQAA